MPTPAEIAKAKKKADGEVKKYVETAIKKQELDEKLARTAEKIQRKKQKIEKAQKDLITAQELLVNARQKEQVATTEKATFKKTKLDKDTPMAELQKDSTTLDGNKDAKKEAIKAVKLAEAKVKKLEKEVAKKDKRESYIEEKEKKQKTLTQKQQKLSQKLDRNTQKEAGKIAFEKHKIDSKSVVQRQAERAKEDEERRVATNQRSIDAALHNSHETQNPPNTRVGANDNVVSAQDPRISFPKIQDVIGHSLEYMTKNAGSLKINMVPLSKEGEDLQARFSNAQSLSPKENQNLNVDYGAWCVQAWVKEAECHKASEAKFDALLKANPGDEFLTQEKQKASEQAKEAMRHAEINKNIALTQGPPTDKLQAAMKAVEEMHKKDREASKVNDPLINLEHGTFIGIDGITELATSSTAAQPSKHEVQQNGTTYAIPLEQNAYDTLNHNQGPTTPGQGAGSGTGAAAATSQGDGVLRSNPSYRGTNEPRTRTNSDVSDASFTPGRTVFVRAQQPWDTQSVDSDNTVVSPFQPVSTPRPPSVSDADARAGYIRVEPATSGQGYEAHADASRAALSRGSTTSAHSGQGASSTAPATPGSGNGAGQGADKSVTNPSL